jgi:hypothetical protein
VRANIPTAALRAKTLLKFTFPFGEGGPLAVDEVCASLFMSTDFNFNVTFCSEAKSNQKARSLQGNGSAPFP